MEAATVAPATGEAAFRSAAELREVFEELFSAVERHERIGPLLRAARIRTRFELDEPDVSINLASAGDDERCLVWSFDQEPPWTAQITLEMDAAMANRWLQGRESVAIAIARRQIRCSGEGRAAVLLVPALKLLVEPYRRLLAASHRHLLVD